MKIRTLCIVVLALLGFGAGLGIYINNARTPAPGPDAKEHRTPAVHKTTQEVKVYRVAVKDEQPRLQATKQKVESDGSPIEMARIKLVEQGDDPDLVNPIPKGTKLLGVEVTNGLAKVDFSHEFRDNFTGGSEGEALIIQVILRTMAQFDEVKKIQILVDGKPLDTLGHAELSEPLDVRWVSPEFNENE